MVAAPDEHVSAEPRRTRLSWRSIATLFDPAIRWFGRGPLALMLVGYPLAMGAYKLGGLTFVVGQPLTVSQFVDPELLQTDYFRSIWYLHSQPPLFNAWMGAVQKWSPFSDGFTYHLTFLLLGFVLVTSLATIARVIGASRWASAALALVITVCPPVVMFQHWFFYDYPMAVLVSATLAAFALWARTRRWVFAAATMGLGCAAVLTRSMMHPIWLAAFGVAILLTAPRVDRRRLALIIAVPLVLVGALVAKNLILFDTPQLSSWFGFNIYRTAVLAQDHQTRERWVTEYDLPPSQAAPCEPAHPDVPVLAIKDKAPEIPNWNWECTLPLFASMESASWRVIRHEPAAFAKAVAGSAEIWFTSNDYFVGVRTQRADIELPSKIWRNAVGLDLTWDPPIDVSGAIAAFGPDSRNHISITAVLTSLIVYAAGLVALIRRTRATRRGSESLDPGASHVGRGRDITLIAIAATIGMSFAIGTVFEHGENARFRFVTEPITLTTAGAVVLAALPRASSLKTRESGRRDKIGTGNGPPEERAAQTTSGTGTPPQAKLDRRDDGTDSALQHPV